MELDTYTDVQGKPPSAAIKRNAREFEGLVVLVGATVLRDVSEDVVNAGPDVWVE